MRIAVVTCVNDFEKYNDCVLKSFIREQKNGTVQLEAIDNTSGRYSLPEALNLGVAAVHPSIVVLCHQDVVFPAGWINKLLDQITLIEETKVPWGVIGTFGVAPNGMFAGHIIDPSGNFHCLPLPCRVQSLDEHCLVIRTDTGLEFDEDIGGFHLYGADICLQANDRGLHNFAVDACVEHFSSGNVDDDFLSATEKLYEKWKNRKPPIAVIQTTCKMIRLKGGLTGLLAYRLARIKRKKRRKKIRRLLEAGNEYTKLRHDCI